MKTEITFTRKDLVVTIFCIVFMLMNMGIIDSSGRRRAKNAVCLSNLQRWGEVFQMYAEDNDGATISDVAYLEKRFPGSEPGIPGAECWASTLLGYYQDKNLLLCPMATKPHLWYGRTYFAWEIPPSLEIAEGGIGSYGINDWAYSGPADSTWGYPTSKCWKSFNVAGADRIPLLTDCVHIGHFFEGYGWGNVTDPPCIEDEPFSCGTWNGVCINRHGEGTLNGLFMDLSARPIGLKELWTLEWHKDYEECNKYTKCGNGGTVPPSRWPEWMRDFEDY